MQGLRRRSIVVAAMVTVLLAAQIASAAPGTLDRTFNRTGLLVTDLRVRDEARAVAVTARGQILVAGVSASDEGDDDLLLVRYTARGRLDRTFGTNGYVTTDVPSVGLSAETAYEIELQSDGKIVIAGETNAGGDKDVVIARYTSRGSLDPTFGSGGMVVSDLAGLDRDDVPDDLAIGPTGTITIGGRAKDGSGDWDLAVARFTATGVLDTSFGDGGDGVTIPKVGSYSMASGAMAVQGDGKLVLAGTATVTGIPSIRDFLLVRFGADGTVDPSFGTSGATVQDLGVSLGAATQEDAFDVGIQTVGGVERILVVGQIQHPTPDVNLAIARFSETGSIDASFGTNGVRVEELGGADAGRALLVRGDGSFAVVGSRFTGSYAIQISFHLASGALDTSGGGTGTAYAQPKDQSFGTSAAFAPNGAVVAVGWAANGILPSEGEHDVTVLRFLAA